MLPIEELTQHAETLGRDAFLKRYKGLYLLRHAAGPDGESDAIPFKTRHLNLEVLRGVRAEDRVLEQTGWAAPVAKREGNPFPDRVSIGRAPNCDIVLRLPYVSKLHAHVVRDADGWSLTDNQSANGTWINEVELPAGVRRQIQPGDWIRVGALHLEVVDGPSLYQRLQP